MLIHYLGMSQPTQNKVVTLEVDQRLLSSSKDKRVLPAWMIQKQTQTAVEESEPVEGLITTVVYSKAWQGLKDVRILIYFCTSIVAVKDLSFSRLTQPKIPRTSVLKCRITEQDLIFGAML